MACGKLGSSETFSGVELFCYDNATCGRFYHPHCAAKLLHLPTRLLQRNLRKLLLVEEVLIDLFNWAVSINKGKVGIKRKSEKPISGSNTARKRKANDTLGEHLDEKTK